MLTPEGRLAYDEASVRARQVNAADREKRRGPATLTHFVDRGDKKV